MKTRPLIVDGFDWGTVLIFDEGDEFPVHVHDEEDNHITILTSGSVRCTGHPKHEGTILEAEIVGTIINWEPGEPHGFVALTPATMINIKKISKKDRR